MQFSNDVYRQTDDILSKRRLNAEKKRLSYLKELYSYHPHLKEIDENISKIGKSALKKLEKNLGASDVITDARKKTDLLIKERKTYIKEKNIKEKKDFYTCKKCKDTGVAEDKYCICRDDIALKIAFGLSGLADTNLPSLSDFKVDLYDATCTKQGKSYRQYAEAIFKIAKKFEKGNLLIAGKSGLGKTFTAECIANKFIENSKTVFYMSSSRLFLMLEEHKFGQDTSLETKERINLMHEADLLIIDDLGTEFRTSSGLVDTFLFELLEYRLKNKKSIILTTNLSSADIKSTYTDRIYSRIIGNFKWLEFFGDDLRLR